MIEVNDRDEQLWYYKESCLLVDHYAQLLPKEFKAYMCWLTCMGIHERKLRLINQIGKESWE